MMNKQSSPPQILARRGFLKHALASTSLVASWPVSNSLVGQTSLAPIDQMTAAIIGAGGIAKFHAANQLQPFFNIKAICDVDSSHADSFNHEFAAGQAIVCRNYQQILSREDIDVVIICTPDHWHTKITLDAVRSGKDVYCEKPLTLTVAEGRLLREALSNTDRIVQVGTQQRSDPRFQTAVALARTGRCGAVKRITAAIGGGPTGGPFHATPPPQELDWNEWLGQAPLTDYIPERCHGNFRWWYEYSGGKMTDWGAHHVDIAQWAVGIDRAKPLLIEPLEVSHPIALSEGMPSSKSSFNTATSFRVRCDLGHGTELIIRDNANDLGFDNGLLFECEAARFFVNRERLSGKPIELLPDDPLPPESLSELRKEKQVMNHMTNFYWSCRDRTPPISDVESHLLSLDLCHLANIALRLGRTLLWDPSTAQIQNDEKANKWLSRPQREGFEIA